FINEVRIVRFQPSLKMAHTCRCERHNTVFPTTILGVIATETSSTISLSFFYNDTAPTDIYTLSLHDALPISQRWTTRDNSDLVERLGVFEQFEQERVSSFVISGVGFFLLAQSKAAAFLSPADFVARFLELRQSDAFQISARLQQSSLIDDVGQFRSGVTGRATRNDGEIDAFGQLHFLGMD